MEVNISTKTEPKRVRDRKEYMREYMKKRYYEKYEEERGYRNSQHFKNVVDLSPDKMEEYKTCLNQVQKLKKIKEKLPMDIILKILSDPDI
jgi:hypothetical protein